MYTETCPAGHTIRSSADRTSQGFCRQCKNDANRRARVEAKAALDAVKAFEAIGVRFVADGEPVAPEAVARQLAELFPFEDIPGR